MVARKGANAASPQVGNTVFVSGQSALDDMTMVNLHMSDLDAECTAMNRINRELFGGSAPARKSAEVTRPTFDLAMEISRIAVAA